MTRVTYLRGAAALPLLPALLYPWSNSPALPELLGFLALTALLGGVPYAAAAGTSLYLLREAAPASYWRLARWAPLLFVPIFVVSLLVFGCVVDSSSRDFDPRRWHAIPEVIGAILVIYAPPILVVGYAYVAIAALGYGAWDRLRGFARAAADPPQ